MATPIDPPGYHEHVDDPIATEEVQKTTEHIRSDKNQFEEVFQQPRLSLKPFPRWVELEDRKSPSGAPLGIRDRLEPITPSCNAPELVPLSPSHDAPEVVQMVSTVSEKMESQEEKIFTPGKDSHTSEKMVMIPNEKMLSSEVSDTSKDKENIPNLATSPTKAKAWYQQRGYCYLLGVVFILIPACVGIAVYLGVTKNHSRRATVTQQTALLETGMAALQWRDLEGIKHYRVYYQDKSNAILESAWESNSIDTEWSTSVVVKSDGGFQNTTSLAAAAGWPHANYTHTLAKNLYYVGSDQALFERQEKSNQTNAWASDNFSGLYKASRLSSLSVYWTQDITNSSQALLVLFQDERPNMFTIGKYTSWANVSNSWVSTQYNFTILDGSPLAMRQISGPRDLLLYAADTDGRLIQYRLNIANDDVQKYGSSDIILSQKNPLTVIIQNNTSLYPVWEARPECSKQLPLTHLLLYTSPDRSKLKIASWNCSSGFIDLTPEIASLTEGKGKFVALASNEDGQAYIQFDRGNGPEIEQWTVPRTAQGAWVVSGIVNKVPKKTMN